MVHRSFFLCFEDCSGKHPYNVSRAFQNWWSEVETVRKFFHFCSYTPLTWYTLFRFTINQCQLQIACHLVNEGRKERGLSPVKLHDLIETMNSQKLSRRKGNPVTTPKKHPATGDLMEKRFIPQLNHMPVPTVGKDGTLYHRQQCAWCSLQKKKKQTWWKCIACDKPLCLNHWVHYHTPALPQSQAHRRDRIIETANGHDLGAEETTQNKEGRKQQKRKSMGMEANLDQSSKKCRRTLNFDS